MSVESARELKSGRITTDVVVVGSGSGGSVVACLLAEAGHEVVLLEEGPYVPPDKYGSWRPSQSLRHIWRDGGMTAVFGVGKSPIINVTMGRVVGGSSVLTGGVCFRTPDYVLNDWTTRLGLDDLAPERMESWFDSVEEAIHVRPVPPEMWSNGVKAFGRGARAMGFDIESMRRNTKGCDGCGRCNFGCPHGAKQSVDITYMPRALAAGARIYSDCLVEKVLTRGGRAIGVAARALDERGRKGSRVELHAKRVVVCAGGMHSPVLLKRSGVGRRSNQVGRNMTLHPSFKFIGRFEERIEGWRGALQPAYSRAWEQEHGITMNGVWIPPAVIAASMPGFGRDLTARAATMPHLAMFGGMIHDEGGGVVRRAPGREPFVTYRMAQKDKASVRTMFPLMAETFFAAGAKEVFLPILGLKPVTPDKLKSIDFEKIPATRWECTSQHPLGTCRMGVDPGSSVVDQNGKTWDLDNLYVADGSVVPSSLGVNPQLTILAMATRIGTRMAESLAGGSS